MLINIAEKFEISRNSPTRGPDFIEDFFLCYSCQSFLLFLRPSLDGRYAPEAGDIKGHKCVGD